VTFGREKRLLLGALAILAPLPLPLNEIVGWPALLVFWLAAGLFVRRAAIDIGGWLPNWAMNLLALAYLPVLFVDLTALWRGRILQPVVHLLLFALTVKLFSLRREKDKWHVLVVVFFLFLAATGTSVHPSVVLYIVAFLAGALLVLSRFASFEMLDRHPHRAPMLDRVPLRGFVAGGVLFAVLVAVPLFAFLPRLRSPYIVGPGGGRGALTQVAGFQNVMQLDGIGRVRGSRQVVARLTYETPPPPRHETRLKVMTYDRFENDEWSRRQRNLRRNEVRIISLQLDGYYPLGEGPVESWMGVWMQPFGGDGLAVPVDGVELDLIPSAVEGFVTGATGGGVFLDDAGVVKLPFARPSMVRYRVGLTGSPGVATSPLLATEPGDDESSAGISPRIANLAGEVMGGGSDIDRARRVETHLSRTFEYTTELIGTPAGERLETFLFESRRGHCELFASSMVLMLRSQGIAARLATGFLGADYNPIEGYYIVRQSNAHAWVEAWIEGAGWLVFDPTPPDGRPAAGDTGLSQLAAQLYDYVIFRWDRYILTYGLADQVDIVASFRGVWETIAGWFSSSDDAVTEASAPAVTPPPDAAPSTAEAAAETGLSARWPLTAVLALASVAFFWLQHRRFSATRAYLRLRERLRGDFGPGLEAVPPLAVAERFAARYPLGAEPARELVDLYLDESFQGRSLTADDLRHARRLLRRALSRRAA
jgi:transglutaminase-like putative cysteine protease